MRSDAWAISARWIPTSKGCGSWSARTSVAFAIPTDPVKFIAAGPLQGLFHGIYGLMLADALDDAAFDQTVPSLLRLPRPGCRLLLTATPPNLPELAYLGSGDGLVARLPERGGTRREPRRGRPARGPARRVRGGTGARARVGDGASRELTVIGALLSCAMDPNVFAGAYLDRRAEERAASDWLQAARRDPASLYLVMHGTQALMQAGPGGEPVGVRFLDAADPRVNHADETRLVLLGWFQGVRCLLVESEPDLATAAGPHETFGELRPFASRLPELEAGLLAYARALAIWRSNHRHCGRCGTPTVPARAGHVLECPACGHQSFRASIRRSSCW